jgi:hypothetical protein
MPFLLITYVTVRDLLPVVDNACPRIAIQLLTNNIAGSKNKLAAATQCN